MVSVIASLIAEGVNRLFPIILLHFAAVRLGVAGLGLGQVSIQLAEILIMLTIAGYHVSAGIDIGKVINNRIAIGKMISEVTLLKTINALFLCVFVLFFMRGGSETIWDSHALFMVGALILTTCVDVNYVNTGTQSLWFLSVLMVLSKIICLAGVIFFVRSPDDTPIYVAFSFLANILVSVVNTAVQVTRFPPQKPSWDAAKKRWRSSLPMAFTILLLAVIDRMDLILVEAKFGVAAAGFYAVPARLQLSIANLFTVVSAIFFSEMVNTHHQRELLVSHVSMAFTTVMSIAVPVVLGVWLAQDQIIELIAGSSFVRHDGILGILVLGSAGSAMINVFGLNIFQVKRKSTHLNLMLVGVVGFIGGAYFFLKPQDGVGIFAWILTSIKIGAGCVFMLGAQIMIGRRLMESGKLAAIFLGGVFMVASIMGANYLNGGSLSLLSTLIIALITYGLPWLRWFGAGIFFKPPV